MLSFALTDQSQTTGPGACQGPHWHCAAVRQVPEHVLLAHLHQRTHQTSSWQAHVVHEQLVLVLAVQLELRLHPHWSMWVAWEPASCKLWNLTELTDCSEPCFVHDGVTQDLFRHNSFVDLGSRVLMPDDSGHANLQHIQVSVAHTERAHLRTKPF
jgi:hypothetical protein